MYLSMRWIYLLLIFDLKKADYAYVRLFNTEDAWAVQSYDCIRYTNMTAKNNETIPYCIRTNESVSVNRSFATHSCENAGKEWSFRSLKEMNVSQDEVLTWNSSIEMADRYAAYLTTGHEQFANDTICNCSSNTFGKFCEYKFMTMNTFEDAIQYQFDLKLKYRNGSQLWGNITCYTTLTNCYFGLRCLSWQNICDGKQQCMDGIDEDYCEELEYNECEENEYRCQDGSCIPEQYWLDGQYDCSDKSDEQAIRRNSLDEYFCPLTSSQFNCDEATAHYEYFTCGDGQFIYVSLFTVDYCYNYRFSMFFCELEWEYITSKNKPRWTLENGHCVEKGWIEKKFTDMDDLEKCIFYLKCNLTGGANVGCDEAIRDFHSLCHNKTIQYPSASVFKPYIQTVYELGQVRLLSAPNYILFNGSIKCIGYQAYSESKNESFDWSMFRVSSQLDSFFCRNPEKTVASGPQFDETCWNNTKQSFLCQESLRCISKHRLRNGIPDCVSEDEKSDQKCYIKKQHRFSCPGNLSLCLIVSEIGDGTPQCDESDDEHIAQLKWNLVDRQCRESNSIECNALKTYIQSPSLLSTTENNKVLLFRRYCDTVWHLPRGFDESLCQEWKCPRDQYQCLSGHCIPLDYVISLDYVDWHCPDASDKIGLFRVTQLSQHNAALIRHSDLQKRKLELIAYNNREHVTAFTTFCNSTEEYGCILANVNDSLNFTINRPCINLTQIGDGIIDCYGGLDERNLLTCGNNVYEQRGFDFHCNDQECIPYHRQCEQRCSNNADSLLCNQLRTLWDWDNFCWVYPRRDVFCTYGANWNCDLYKMNKYYCDTSRTEQKRRATPYRLEAWLIQKTSIYLPQYPVSKDTAAYSYVQPPQQQMINAYSRISHERENDGKEGWICGRGVAVRKNENDEVQCFCPPSLYGQYCQYFSDRITVIISFNNTPAQLAEQQSNTIKILALLLTNDDIIDYDIFHLPLVISRDLHNKFRFNLIHQRPKLSSNSYTVRFEAYHLSSDSSIKFLTVWEYPVQFVFLPSYRLVQILNFEKESPLMTTVHICRTDNPCLNNSTCHPIMNKMNNMSAFYCYCNIHTFGKQCEHLFQPTPLSLCSEHALVRSFSSLKSLCLCPIHSYGPTCHLNHSYVNKNWSGFNRGKCYVNPDNIVRDYICICDKKFFGDQCQYDSSMVRINFTDHSFIQIPSDFILSSVIQLCDLHNETLDLIIRQKRVYQGLPPPITDIYHDDHHLPMLGIMKLYHKHDLSNDYVANLERPDYFIVYIALFNVSRINLTSIINKTNYCPYTPTVFYKNISDVSYLSQLFVSNDPHLNSEFNASVMIFKYHLLCDASYSLMCFHDDNYFCLCDMNGHAECSRYDSKVDECHGRCLADGQCVHGDLDDRNDFICLCPRCYYGSVCQHNTLLFSFTLEPLLTNDLYAPSVVVQHLFFSLLIIIPVILFLIGAVNNVCCYVTFNRPKPLLVGIGHYLYTVSIINQLTLLMLLLKLIHLVLSIKGYIVHHLLNTILCKVLSYLLVCTSRMSYWLMCMVAIERVYVTWYLKGAWLKHPQVAKRVIASIIIGIVVFDIHEVIYYQSIEDPKSLDMNNSTWCVTSYPSVIATYNQVNIILNYIMPILINLLSTIIIMILITRKRNTIETKKTDRLHSEVNARFRFQAYINLMVEHKELILAPIITLVPQLPQFILSFLLACQEFKVDWQRYLLFVSYFITYLPQVFSYKLYVSPSSFYKREFHATKLYKRIAQWGASIRQRPLQTLSTTFSQTNDQIVTRL